MTVTPKPTHCAKFSGPILDTLRVLLRAEARRLDRPIRVLDPFAGVGRVHSLAEPDRIETVGVEIEPEWAACHSRTICADSLGWMRDREPSRYEIVNAAGEALDDLVVPFVEFDAIATSPTYGNRMADSFAAKDDSKRNGYHFALGRRPTVGSSSTLQWGAGYWQFHAEAYRLMLGVVRPGGLLLLNVSDFVRGKALVPAVTWHRGAAWGAGWVEDERPKLVETSRLRFGQNHDARAGTEAILRLRRPYR